MRAKLIDDKCVSADHREPQGLFMRARTLSSRSFIGTSRLLSSPRPIPALIDNEWRQSRWHRLTLTHTLRMGNGPDRTDGRTDGRMNAFLLIFHPLSRVRSHKTPMRESESGCSAMCLYILRQQGASRGVVAAIALFLPIAGTPCKQC